MTTPADIIENVRSNLSPLEPERRVIRGSTDGVVALLDVTAEFDAVIDPRPAIRCKPEVGVVLAGPDGPILTVDPLDGGNVWEVNIGDVVAWAKAHTAVLDFEDGSL